MIKKEESERFIYIYLKRSMNELSDENTVKDQTKNVLQMSIKHAYQQPIHSTNCDKNKTLLHVNPHDPVLVLKPT